MPMPHQTDTIIWIPISEKLPPSGAVLASTQKHCSHPAVSQGSRKKHAQRLLDGRGKEGGHPV
jgi:hypothetical protein